MIQAEKLAREALEQAKVEVELAARAVKSAKSESAKLKRDAEVKTEIKASKVK